MPNKLIRIALLAILVLLFQGTWALGGTTGTVSGYVLLQDNSPIAGAKVTASSPSETTTTPTDPTGHFVFVSLTPDTYTLTATKDGYDTVSQAGITVIADNTQTVTLHTQKSVRVIGVIPVTAANELVKPGTTADVYSVNAAQSSKLSNLGGGGGADNIYGAIASMPGAFVPPGQYGWYQTVHIRGGDYDQVGYEYDGVPVNRSFDNYPTTTGTSTGSSEVQLYTGAAPQNAEGQGLAGFINQVIKNGTFPGFATLDLGIGGPSFYNKANLEIGGATPNRNFTYYVATGGYNVRPRLVDNSNGASLTHLWGVPFDAYLGGAANTATCPFSGTTPNSDKAALGNTGDSCSNNYNNALFFGAIPGGPAGYILGPYEFGSTFQVADRENVINLHFGLPHKSDSGKDDIQFLYSNSLLRNPFYESQLNWSLAAFTTDLAVGAGDQGSLKTGNPVWYNGYQSNNPTGTVYTSSCAAPCGIVTYLYPSSNAVPVGFGSGAVPPDLPAGQTDTSENGQGIFKLQYQHNIGSNAYLRVYGYSYYSWWFLYGPNSLSTAFVGCCPGDYELTTHTRGASAEFADQINPTNLITAQISGITASTVRDNNRQMESGGFSTSRSVGYFLVDANSPYSGLCFKALSGALRSCRPSESAVDNLAQLEFCSTKAGTFGDPDGCVQTGGLPNPTAFPYGSICGVSHTDPCAWLQAENGRSATYNTVKPTFYSASLGDQLHVSDKLQLNLGVRFDSFAFQGTNTDTGNARTFWFAVFNNENCNSPVPGSQTFNKYDLGSNSTVPCSALTDPLTGAADLTATNLLNTPSQKFTYTEFQPRLGGTLTTDPDNVFRFSIGKYDQAPNAAFEQYNTLQENLAAFIGPTFLKYGLNTPGHQIPPEDSWNGDLSWEHRFANTDTSFKLTPFYRTTRNQSQQLYLDQKTSFVSGLAVGKQTSEGVEFELQKGDFNRNGLSGLLTYTYTWSYIKYGALPGNGGTVLSPINNAIQTYNAYTSFCVANPSDARCGKTTSGLPASPCYGVFGSPTPGCPAGSLANPYWNAPVQPLFDVNAQYIPYDIFPGAFNASTTSYAVPHVGTLVLNWKHDKFSISPSVQYFGEGFYGAPLQSPGVNLESCKAIGGVGCTAFSAGPVGTDPRYPYGAPAGSPYDAVIVPGNIMIPDPFTGRFDNLGAFRTPQALFGHLQLSYEATPRITYVANFANIVSTCWGGSKMPWTALSDHRVCTYNLPGYAPMPYAGNFYNPDSVFQPEFQFPYMQYFGTAPVQGTFEMKIKL